MLIARAEFKAGNFLVYAGLRTMPIGFNVI